MVEEDIRRRMAELQASESPEVPQMADSGSDQFKTIEFLVQDESIPSPVRDIFWAFSDKENEISKMSDRDIKIAMMTFDIAKLKHVIGIPEYEYSFPASLSVFQMRHKFKVKLLRSHGGFERRQISGHETRKEMSFSQPPKKGRKVFGHLFGKGESNAGT